MAVEYVYIFLYILAPHDNWRGNLFKPKTYAAYLRGPFRVEWRGVGTWRPLLGSVLWGGGLGAEGSSGVGSWFHVLRGL